MWDGSKREDFILFGKRQVQVLALALACFPGLGYMYAVPDGGTSGVHGTRLTMLLLDFGPL